MRHCWKCDRDLDDSSFYSNKGKVSWCRECYNQWQRSYRKIRDPRIDMLMRCRKRAKKKGLPCNLTLDDFVIPDKCPALGIKIERSTTGIQNRNSPSVDRLDPRKGYVKGNVVVISALANAIKQNATARQILSVGLWLAEQRGQSHKDIE